MSAFTPLGLRNKIGWARLTSMFLASQSLVRAVNLVVGLLLIRLLPVDQYALYTVAGALIALLAVGSNFGVSQAVITHGAKLANDPHALGGLVNTALAQSRWLYAATLPILLGVAAVMLAPHDWSLLAKALAVTLVVAIGWMRIPTMIVTSVLNIRHDSHGLFQIGISEAFARLALIPLCFISPYAGIALFGGLAGASLARWTGQRRLEPLVDHAATPTPEQTAAIRGFILPLAPIIIYTALQAQIAILILGLFGNTSAIAEVGAITRLNQIIVLGMLLNPFLVQPVLARQLDRGRFIGLVGLVMVGLTLVSAIVMASAYVVPGWWLLILGGSYSGLERELPVALATGMLTLIGGTLYTVVISRGRTAGQYWSIAPSITGQVAFIGLHGVATAFDALVLSLIPALAYATVQVILFVRVVSDWRPAPAPASSKMQ